MTKTHKEEILLRRLAFRMGRRDRMAAKIAELDEQLRQDRKALASERGLAFLREEAVRVEIRTMELES